MNSDTAMSLARVALGKLRQLDEINEIHRTEENYEGWMNGFADGVVFADSTFTPEDCAFDFTPKAHIRVIVGIQDSVGSVGGETSAYAIGISSECKGVIDRHGVISMLSAALATISRFVTDVSCGVGDKAEFAESITRAAEAQAKALKNEVQANLTIMEVDGTK